MSKSRGNVVDPWEVIDAPRRRRLPLVLPHLPAALGRLPLLDRDGRRVRAPVPADAVEHLLVLGPLRERRGARRGDRAPAGPGARARARTSTAGSSRGCRRDRRSSAPSWTTSTAPAPGQELARVRRRALELVRAALAPALLGRRRAPRSGRFATAWSRSRSCSRRSSRSSTDEIYSNLSAGDGDSVHLSDFPRAEPSSPRRRARGRRRGGAARGRAGPRRPRRREGEDAPAAAQGGDRRHRAPSARRSSGSATSFAPSST